MFIGWLVWVFILEDSPNGGFLVHHYTESYLVVVVKSKQHLHQSLIELKGSVLSKLIQSLSLGEDGVLRDHRSFCVPNVDDLRN